MRELLNVKVQLNQVNGLLSEHYKTPMVINYGCFFTVNKFIN